MYGDQPPTKPEDSGIENELRLTEGSPSHSSSFNLIII